MALNISEQPGSGTNLFLSDVASFKANLDTIDPAKIHKIRTQVFQDSPEKALGSEGSVRISTTSQVIPLDIMNEAKGAIVNFVPDLVKNTTFISDTGFASGVFLRYSEVAIESGVIPVPVVTDSDVFNVIGAYIQPYQEKPSGDNFILTDKKRVTIFRDAFDWIRCHGTITGTITLKVKGLPDETINLDGTDGLFPTGPAQILEGRTNAALTYAYDIAFSSGETIKYSIKEPCCSEDERVDIYYREPKGSWGVMHFKCPDKENIEFDSDEVALDSYFGNDMAIYFKNYGRVANKYRSWVSVDLQKVKMIDSTNIEAFRAFANAREYRAIFRFQEGSTKRLAPFISTTKKFSAATKNMSNIKMSGFYGIDLR